MQGALFRDQENLKRAPLFVNKCYNVSQLEKAKLLRTRRISDLEMR